MWSNCICLFFVIILSISLVYSKKTLDCKNEERSEWYLEMAVNMIEKAKAVYSFGPSNRNLSRAVDCSELLHMGYNKSGVYTIWPRNRIFDDRPLDVFCDMETDGGGWTVIQRRGNFGRPKDYFFKVWQSYKKGFGDIEKDFWLGNDNIFGLSNQRKYAIRFDLKDVEGNTGYALYDTFWIDDENHKYMLHIKEYSGTVGDSMIPEHDNKMFTTKDQDNDTDDRNNCGKTVKGGWWYEACHQANLNGLDLQGKHESWADGIEWFTWRGYKESLATSEMKIRPRSFGKKTEVL